jgi:hypothetical protein
MAKTDNRIQTPTTKDMTGEQIQADRNAVTAWLAENSAVIIDSFGVWRRGERIVKRAKVPVYETGPLWDWR